MINPRMIESTYRWIRHLLGQDTNDLTLGGNIVVGTKGTWTPTVTGSSSNPTITYTNQTGRYTQLDDWVLFVFRVTINTYSGGSGVFRVSLPVAVSGSYYGICSAFLSGPAFPTSTGYAVFLAQAGQSYGDFRSIRDNTGAAQFGVTEFASGDDIIVSGSYYTDA